MALTIRGTEEVLSEGSVCPLGLNIPGLSYLGMVKRKGPINGEVWTLRYWSHGRKTASEQSPAETAYNMINGDFSAVVEAEGAKHILTVTTPEDPTGDGEAVITTQFELFANASQLDLREHPKALSLGHATLKIIDGVINGAQKTPGVLYAESDIPSNENAQKLYALLRQRNGNAAFQKSQYVFRYTRITTYNAVLDVGFSDVGKIHTTNQMTAQTGPPPGILASIADAYTTSEPTPAEGYQYGWLKQTPTVTTTAGNKYQISGEYWLELWSTWIYETAS